MGRGAALLPGPLLDFRLDQAGVILSPFGQFPDQHVPQHPGRQPAKMRQRLFGHHRPALRGRKVQARAQGFKQKGGQRHAVFIVSKGHRAVFTHKAVGVFALRQEDKIDLPAIAQSRERVLHGPPGGLFAGRIAVKAEHQFVGLAKQPVDMAPGQRRAEAGHAICEAKLGQRDHIHIAFHDIQTIGPPRGLARLIQPVQFLALVKDRGLG